MPNEANTKINVRLSAVRFSKSHDIDMIKRGKQRVERLSPSWTLGRQKQGRAGSLKRQDLT